MKSFLNIFFLLNTILSSIKIFSTKSPASTLSPFLIVISIGLVLDGIEEIKRYRNDVKTNNTKVKVYKNKKMRNMEWKKVKIGNLVKVKKEENFPADMLVIYSSNKEQNFYLQTSNIDGETSLKERDALDYTQKLFSKKNFKKNYENLKNLFINFNEQGNPNCILEVEQPNKNIYKINGSIFFNGDEENKKYFNIKNVAIRGAKLKNTEFIYGIIIYTGNETKIMKNIVKHRVKSANIDKWIDNIVIILLILRFIYIIIFMLIGMSIRYKYLPSYSDKDKDNIIYDYLFYYRHFNGHKEKKDNLENTKFFTAHFIASATLLPTSVVLLSAISKVIQSLFLEFLEKPLREKENQKMKCFSTELLSDLGSIKYIFSDKTGTLTKNETQFKACSIFTYLFDENDTFDDKSKSGVNSFLTPNNYSKKVSTASRSNFSINFDTSNILKSLKLKNIPLDIKNIKGCPFKDQGEALEEFMHNMSLNHDILVENNINKNNIQENEEKNININYQGINPDEMTLVGAAKELGYCFLGKYGNILKIRRTLYNAKGTEEGFEIKKFNLLLKIPFESARQRSSVVVRDLKSNKIKIYIKGSDTKIFERLNKYSNENILEITRDHVNSFSRRGLRILCYSYRIITEEEWNDWFKEYNKLREEQKLNNSIGDKFEELYDLLEKDCYLLGATALEDQLQDGVKDDVQQFIEAGINFWMLTGDKMDTAESIGYSIKLFDSDTEVFKINGKNEEEIIERMKEIKENITKTQKELSNFNIDDNENNKKDNVDKKVEILKLKVKNKIKTIYEDENDDNNNDKMEIENGQNKEIINIKEEENNYYHKKGHHTLRIEENGNNNFINNNNGFISSERLLQKKNIENFMEENDQERNYKNKKDYIPNMSIFKFMVDNQYFVNSDIELENFTLIKEKALKPEFSSSENKSENDKSLSNGSSKKMFEINTSFVNNNENKNNEKNGNNEETIRDENNCNNDFNISFANSIDIKYDNQQKGNKNKINRTIMTKNRTESNYFEDKEVEHNFNEINEIKVINNNDNDNIKELAYNLNIKENNNKKINLKNSQDMELLKQEKEEKEENKRNESTKNNLSEIIKMQRSRINLPTKASTFLKYFGECLDKAKEAFNIHQKAFSLFKVPYLYNTPNKEDILDNKSDSSKKTNKSKIKNYLLHTKIKYSLIIQGESVHSCTLKGEASDLFWFLIKHSRSIICCRCSPIQKSKIVKFVRQYTKDLTLGIGDGENDVNMIKTSHIGIGIYGKEGSQAAYNADYAFYEFKYLKRLLFGNGRFILLRNSYLYNSYFSKNFVFTLQYLILNFFTLYSGTFLFDEYYDSMFNTFVSILPLVTFSIIEEDIDINFNNHSKKEKVMMTYLLPDMYKEARDIKPLNVIRYLIITFLSLIMAIIFFGFFSIAFKGMIKNNEGKVTTFYELSFYLYFSIVATHLIMVYIDTSLFNYIIFIIFSIQIIIDILFVVIMNSIDNDFQLSNIVGEVTNSTSCFLVSIGICSLICICFYILRRAEMYFGLNLVNLIKMNKIEAIYLGKYYKKKINQMIRAIRGIVKFKKIRKEMNEIKNDNDKIKSENENLVDIKMKKMVEHYENKRTKKNKI